MAAGAPLGPQGVRVLSIFDEETVPVEDGTLEWLPLRRRLGIRAFGTNAYRAARAGDRVVEEHVESPGQEELYVVVRGGARFRVGDEELEASAGTAVFLPDPELRRGAIATEDATVVLAVGGWPGRAYHPLPWEPIFLAQEPMRRGDWGRALEILEREAGEQRESPFVRFRIACCHTQLGQHDSALRELRLATEDRPALREAAGGEEALAPLRQHEDWNDVLAPRGEDA
jgi:hypothetical protein